MPKRWDKDKIYRLPPLFLNFFQNGGFPLKTFFSRPIKAIDATPEMGDPSQDRRTYHDNALTLKSMENAIV